MPIFRLHSPQKFQHHQDARQLLEALWREKRLTENLAKCLPSTIQSLVSLWMAAGMEDRALSLALDAMEENICDKQCNFYPQQLLARVLVPLFQRNGKVLARHW